MTLLALLATVTLFALLSSAVGQPDTITPVRRWITAPPSDENAPYWVGYIYINHTFQGFDCNPGATFTVIGNAAGCVSAPTYVTIMQTSCSDSSVLVGPPGYTPYTCPTGEACQVGFILKSFIDTVTTTIVSCDEGTSFNFTVYRATTYSITTPPSVEASTTLDTTSFTMSTGSSSATSSSSIQTSSQSATASSSNDNSNAIALGVGIGVGLPSILIAFCAWWFPRQRKKEHDALETREESTMLSSPPHNPDRLGNTIELNDTRSPHAANENGYAVVSSDTRSPHNPSERGITIESSDTRLTRGTAG